MKYLQASADERQRKAHGGTDNLYFKEVLNTHKWLWLKQNVEQLLMQKTSSIIYWEQTRFPRKRHYVIAQLKTFYALVQIEVKQAPH